MKKVVNTAIMTMMEMCMWAFYMCKTCVASFSGVFSVSSLKHSAA